MHLSTRRRAFAAAWLLAVVAAFQPYCLGAEIGAEGAASIYEALPNLPALGQDEDQQAGLKEITDNLRQAYEMNPAQALEIFSTLNIEPADAALLAKPYVQLTSEEKGRFHAALVKAVRARVGQVNGPRLAVLEAYDSLNPRNRVDDPEAIRSGIDEIRELPEVKPVDAPFQFAHVGSSLDELKRTLREKDDAHRQQALESKMARFRRALLGERVLEADPEETSEDELETLKKKIGRPEDRWSNVAAIFYYHHEHRKYILVQVVDDSRSSLEQIPVEFDGMDILIRKGPNGPIIGLNGARKDAVILDRFQENMNLVLGHLADLFGVYDPAFNAKVLRVHNENYQVMIQIWGKLHASNTRPSQEEARELVLHLRAFEKNLNTSSGDAMIRYYFTLLSTLHYYAGTKA